MSDEPVVRDSSPSRRVSSGTYVILLLSVALFVSYIDRGALATAGPLLESQLHLSASKFGLLLSVFYITYVAGMIPAGWLAERFGGYLVLAVGLAIWSVSTLLMGVCTSFSLLLVLRLGMGLGESVTFPCASKLIATAVGPERVGFANGCVAFGYLFGAVVGTLVGGLLMARVGWQPVFVIFGAVSLIWLLPWARVRLRELRTDSPEGEAPTFTQIIRQRGLWGACLGHFSGNYTYYFILGWLPEYLVKARGFSMDSMAKVASSAYLISAVLAFGAGWLTDRWVRGGRSADLAYKSIMALHHVGSIVCMVGMALLPVGPSIACLYGYMVVMALAAPATFAIPTILAGPTATGRWVGIQSTCGNLAGVFASYLTGLLVDATGHFESAFAAAAIINVLGIVGWVYILPSVRPISWAASAMHGVQARRFNPET
jgi:MFS family permease